jgi:hypothetical protein
MRTIVLTALLLAPPVSAQVLQPRPVITLGGATADPDDELVRVTGARRLPDGRIVVAIGNPIELRVYSPAGRLVNRIGRRGGGPGEFRAAVTIPYADNDSIVTYTDGHSRLAVFAPDGKLLRDDEQQVAAAPPLLLNRALLHAPGSIANGCARAVMMALPRVAPANLHEVFPDRSGHLWAHALHDRTWRVYSQAGPFLGSVTLPPGARVLDFGANFMLVHMRDTDDLEQVVEYRVSIPAGAVRPACAARSDTFPLLPATDARTTALRQVLREAMTANEVVFSNIAHYPSTADSLQLKLPAGTVARVIEASRGGYTNAILDARSSLVCVVRVGSGSFLWREGTIFCGN